MRRFSFLPLSTLFSLTDEEAMLRVQKQGDLRAFELLVQRWERPLQRLCRRLIRDSHLGEDLAQEAFARLFAHRKKYQPNARFSTFIWRIALNLCYDELRRMERRGESSLDNENSEGSAIVRTLVAPEPLPDEILVERERDELVRKALLQVPECYRTVVILRHYENLKFREIAEVLKIPEGTVKSRMAEALTQLARLLKAMKGEE